MSRAEQQELHPAPEEGPRQELRSFPFYSEAKERLLKGQETLKRAGDDPELLGVAFLKLHGALEKINGTFLSIFKPIYEPSTGFIDDPLYAAFRTNLWDLRLLDLIKETDYKILFSEENKRARDEFAHGGEFLLSKEGVEIFTQAAERVFQNLIEKTCELWKELVTLTNRDHYGSWTRREWVKRQIWSVLTEDITEQRDEWVDPFFGSEEEWWLFEPALFPKPNNFSPLVPLTKLDFVVTTQEEASVDNPFKISLFARLLTGEDLSDVKPETFKDFLDQDFPVVVFIPEKHREGFLSKLDSIKEEVSFVGYHYDKNAELHLTLEKRT